MYQGRITITEYTTCAYKFRLIDTFILESGSLSYYTAVPLQRFHQETQAAKCCSCQAAWRARHPHACTGHKIKDNAYKLHQWKQLQHMRCCMVQRI
jgi:hypothetical protein